MWNPSVTQAENLSASSAGKAPSRREDHVLLAMRDLVQHARRNDLALADEVLTDILAKLSGWPVEELTRLP